MANTYLKTPNSKYILPHLTTKEKRNVNIKSSLNKRYKAVCEWFGIDNCNISQLWFFGTFGLSTFMIVATYIIAGFLYGF
ncbi:hypothetical protein COM11_25395 [Bacillus pseudomycoides]|uniref:hypothetical protein n=1 Tax=Bacillus pseudomycoides TaxID=64104 RepID=UPI000BEFAB8A|nr:hypothetical protein [Bacillus pseudomycoides]PEI52371.1 hypothetical protein CN641_00255 [Bacillus pseudomycoides]PGC23516.1 hypothetical protein COM11_25395 [Bacillus pseudomycoides]PHE92008.1 hypothetical protein COF78_17975 [Bacillus pseudomycoides]